jgi:hypothetical protein
MSWFYTTASVRPPRSPEGSKVEIDDLLRDDGWTDLGDRLYSLLAAGREQPAFAFVGLLVLAMLYFFLAGAKKPRTRIIEGGVHWAVHMLAMSMLTQALLIWDPAAMLASSLSRSQLVGYIGQGTVLRVVINSAVMIALGALVAGTIIAIYLFFGCRVFKTHADNGFSSIRIAGYKNFLRMRITENDLTIYPIGVVRVPTRAGWREATAEEVQKGVVAGYLPRWPMKPRLIEGPIVIRPSDIIDLKDDVGQTAARGQVTAPETMPALKPE